MTHKLKMMPLSLAIGVVALGGATLCSLPALAAGAKNDQTPYIQEVYVDLEAQSLVILGEGFNARGRRSDRSLTIELGALGDISSSCLIDAGGWPQAITCDFAAEGLPAAGSYRLVVAQTSKKNSVGDAFDLTIGGGGGEGGPAGPIGPAGPAGPTGATGATGATGPTGPAGPMGLQGEPGNDGAQGEPGPRGEPGIFGVMVEYAEASASVEPGGLIMAMVICPDNQQVLSAGFSTWNSSSPEDLVVIESTRIAQSVWGVAARNRSTSTQDAVLSVSGICADFGESNTSDDTLPR